jgi:hypothetical protein
MATVHVHPPLAVHLVAAVNVPAGVPWILYTGEAHRNASSHAVPPNPTTWSEECVVTPWRAGAVPAAVNAGPSGHGIRTTGATHVEGSRGSTPRTCSCSSIASIQARTMSGATALRITTNPLGVKSLVDTAISLLWRPPPTLQ